ncbi:hypothetical protein [Haloferula sp. A504]|uniref:hypothetical protein n=1 Tax=Haloferula sp. A504 TaxID=3373601 RepID=UPI0031C32826|nr:hypothetical protein [Verrucomicrobiaceae bacterium E54]
MFSASQLTEEQKQSLQQWAAEGASIADLQRRLKDEYSLTITYMDARFMVLDLGIEILEEKEEEESDGKPEDETLVDAVPEMSPGAVNVSIDSIAIPGAVVSGKVTFSDGETAVWMIDQMGRPGLDPDTPGYRPSQEDIESFQKQLSELMRKQGM